MRQKYQGALSIEVDGFQERVTPIETQGLRRFELVKAVAQGWEDTKYIANFCEKISFLRE